MRKLFYIISVLCLLVSVSFAATYKTKQVASGDESGSSCANAIAVSSIMTTANAGDIIEVCDGETITTTFIPTNLGSSGLQITYKAETQYGATISTSGDGTDLTNKDYITIQNFYFNDCGANWIELNNSDYNVIQDNKFLDSARYSGIYFNSANSSNYNKFIDNIFEDAPTGGSEASNPVDFVTIRGSYNVFSGNTFAKASHDAIYTSSGNYNVFRDNTFQNVWHVGLNINVTGPNLIEDNFFYDQGSDYLNDPTPAGTLRANPGFQLNSENNIVRGNIFDDNGAGLTIASTGGRLAQDNRVYNNTMNTSVRVLYSVSDGGADITSGNIFKNNIFTDCYDGVALGRNIHLQNSDGTNRWYNNVGSGGDDDYYYVDSSYVSFAALIAAKTTQFVSGNLTDDPKYVDANNRDFTLQSSSTLIDAGTFLTETNGAAGGGSSASLTVDDAGYFYDGWSIPGETADYIYIVGDGTPANVLVQISSINYGTNVITLVSAQNWDDAADIYLAYSSTIGLIGTAPDIGAEEYLLQVHTVSPTDGGTGINVGASATWDYESFVDDADIWLDKAACSTVACDGSLVSNDDADKTYDMSTLDVSSTYCLGIRANDGAQQGTCQEFEFTTASGPPVVAGSKATIGWASGAGDIVWNDSGMVIK